MNSKLTYHQYLWIVLIPLLMGCGFGATTVRPTEVDVNAISTQAVMTAMVQMTQTVALQASATIPPTQTLSPTSTPLPTSTPGKPFALEMLRMVYVKDGNLYIQNGANPLIQLTHSGKDRSPLFSDDGKKIVFYRGEAFDNVYMINADGTQEKLIIMSKSLPVLGRGDVKFLTFRPNTDELLFNTYLCDETRDYTYVFPPCTVGIFGANTDTGEIRQLRAGMSGDVGQGRNFEVSPNGRYLSIATSGDIDILDLINGQIAIPHILSYRRTLPNEFLPPQYWLSDSRGLIAVFPVQGGNEPTTLPHIYTVWRFSRYAMNDTGDHSDAVQIQLDAPVMWNGCSFSISPDRNWIYYVSTGTNDITGDYSLYIGNLNDGHTKSYEWGGCPSSYYHFSPQWSPDSKHFAYDDFSGNGSLLGAIDQPPVPITGKFIEWIDASHYFYDVTEKKTLKTYIGEIGEKSNAIALSEGFSLSTFVILNPKVEQ